MVGVILVAIRFTKISISGLLAIKFCGAKRSCVEVVVRYSGNLSLQIHKYTSLSVYIGTSYGEDLYAQIR